MSDYYTQTCFEITNVSPMEATWLEGTLNVLMGLCDGRDSVEDADEETQAIWAEVKECGYLAPPYTRYDEHARTATIVGEDISIDVLNIVLKAFLKRWNRVDTIEYTWSHRSDNCEEVGEFYGGAESVCAVETPRTRDEVLNEIAALFKEEFGDIAAEITSSDNVKYSYAFGELRVTGPLMFNLPFQYLKASDTAKYARGVMDLWPALEESRKRHIADESCATEVAQRTLDVLRAKKAGK